MKENPTHAPPLLKSRGTPGAGARARGFTQALSPFIGMVFGAGWVFGAVVSPAFMREKHAGVLLILLALGLYITWRRAVNLLSRHEEGARGEEQVARILEALPEGWRIFHGVELAGREVDHVLVSSEHLFTLETVHWPGAVDLVNGKLMHGESFYPGYDLDGLRDRARRAAVELGLSPEAVSPMVCIVGGRFGELPGIKQGVWVGEIQDMGAFLLQPHGEPLNRPARVEVVRALESKLTEETEASS